VGIHHHLNFSGATPKFLMGDADIRLLVGVVRWAARIWAAALVLFSGRSS
jgi:hypothetical protein